MNADERYRLHLGIGIKKATPILRYSTVTSYFLVSQLHIERRITKNDVMYLDNYIKSMMQYI